MQVRDDGGEVAVAGALAQAVQGALHVAGAGQHGGHRVGDGAAGVVVAVDADGGVVAHHPLHVGHDLGHLVRQRAAIGVAEHQVARSVHDGGLDGSQRELGVVLVPVEEVLEVDEHSATVAVQELHRVGDHRRTLVERGLQCLEHVIVPALGDDAHGRGLCIEQVAQRGVVVDLAARPARAAEGDHRRRGEVQFGERALEELDVLGVGTRPPTLDEVHAEVVELLGDAQLVVDRGRHALHLEAVAQRGVEDFDEFLVGVHGECFLGVRRRVVRRNERAARRGGSERTSA